ncbi:hypothetical protein GPECTOR_426g291 [Gonium pectorale]|uniref:Uncharacterized protein n=1 Tax=Gonium pectorale TaxID=33097 RepID=A0A150FV57_GONPE|nr:hypothetical protein GPECTOR_426g291 [Gonium pectorale]|eukprot:KXZ41503.1 hypothetical protein GPECTOR_426g291 [Gonium pectorale]
MTVTQPSPVVDDDTAFLKLTATAMGTEAPTVLNRALEGIRAADRYHRYRMGARRAVGAVGPGDDIAKYSREYGIDLGRGAIIMLREEKGKPVIRLVHVIHFAVPHITPEELRGEAPLPNITHMDWYDTDRPPAIMRSLAARSLGPLPDDLVDSLLPKPLSAGGDALALATHAFSAWLGGLPVGEVVAPQRPDTPEQRPDFRRSASESPLTVLRTLWRSMSSLGSGRSSLAGSLRVRGEESGGEEGSVQGGVEVSSLSADAGGGGSRRSTASISGGVDAGAGEAAAARLAAAWAEFERRVAAREPTYNNELEREWFERYLLNERGYGSMTKRHDAIEFNAAGEDITILLDGH